MNNGGKREGAGRKKGVPNKFNQEVKAAIEEAFEAAGGAKYLEEVARDNPAVFCTLLGRVLPKVLVADINIRPLVKRIDLSGGD